METAVKIAGNPDAWTIICDDSCIVVRMLAHMVTCLDRKHTFKLLGKTNNSITPCELITELERSSWSLMLIDDEGTRRYGPEAIPFILKNLSSGRIAVALYLIPGTMWLTRQLYMLVSRNRKKLSGLNIVSKATTNPN